LRHPLHRLRGLPKESYRHVSEFPVLGSLFVALSLVGLHEIPAMRPVAIIVMLIDTGGIHWTIGWMIYQFVHEKKHS
jgi:hypothetical protein